jgi:amidase
MVDDVLWNRAALELAAMIADGEVSSREVVDAHLERIHEVNGRLNAAVLLLEGSARSAADAADRVTSAGLPTGPFHGVPMTVKDGLDLAGHATTYGVEAFAHGIATLDDPGIGRLMAAGAIPIAKTNLPEMGMRLATDNPLFGLTRNPWHPDRPAGGSSGGEASASRPPRFPWG